ncbi:MAG: serine--glyoxylate aminotransferase, partial [Proteobacteria bacterium]|nr:serine--glyoxylate aminotransferase [Pseudomonadota bacterium]
PEEYSPVLTTVVMPGAKGADAYRGAVLDKFNMSLGSGLGKLKDRVFRIGHLGAFNDLSLIGTLGGVEMGFALTGVPYKQGGVAAAMEYLAAN